MSCQWFSRSLFSGISLNIIGFLVYAGEKQKIAMEALALVLHLIESSVSPFVRYSHDNGDVSIFLRRNAKLRASKPRWFETRQFIPLSLELQA